MAESMRVVRRLLRSGHPVRSVLVTESAAKVLDAELSTLLDAADPAEIFEIPDGLQESIAGSRFHGGALAVGLRPRRPPSLGEVLEEVARNESVAARRRIVMIEGVTHPDNIGAIFRSAACLGVHGIVLDGACADPLLRKAIRYSMGRVFSLPWTTVEGLAAAIEVTRERGYAIAAAETDRRAVPAWSLDRRRPMAILVGGEAAGVSSGTLEAVDAVVSIPIAGDLADAAPDDIASLNVAVATALVVEELRPDRPDPESARFSR